MSNKEALQLSRYYTVSDSKDDYVTLSGFSESEFSVAYPKYATRYSLKTSPEKIQEDRFDFVRRRLYDPLILKTASTNFSGRELPDNLRQFNSTKLFAQVIERLGKVKYGDNAILILEEFTAILWEGFTDSIRLNGIQSAYENNDSRKSKLAAMIFKDDTFSFKPGFSALLDEGILRIERNVRREIRFVYERFSEYMFAEHFLQSNGTSNRTLPIPADVYEAVLDASGHSTVIIAALRNALIMDYDNKKDHGSIIKLALSSRYDSQSLIEEMLTVLINESYFDVLSILEVMLTYELDASRGIIARREELEDLLKKDKSRARLSESAKAKTAETLRELDEHAIHILKMRKIAISLIYKIFKSDQIDVYLTDDKTDPSRLLWIAMADPMPEVRDNASIYIYYISRYRIDLGMRLVSTLSDRVKATPVVSLLRGSSRRELQQSYIEPSARLGLFLAIDGLIERKDYVLAKDIQNTWKQVVSKFTLNHALIKIVMPFFKFLMARQTVVQTEYVNNAIEYKHFWDTIPVKAADSAWSQTAYKTLVPFLNPEQQGVRQHEEQVFNGYLTGDSFSFFLLERVLVVQGLANWNNVSSLVDRLSTLPAAQEYKAYVEMSLLYSLYQISLKSPAIHTESLVIFTRLARSWSLKQKGFYYAHYNDKANGGNPYKQYVLNWYIAVYCHYYGDGSAKPGDDHAAPLVRELLKIAYDKKDKALLYTCVENMAMVVPSSNYYKTSLQLFEYIISLFQTESEVHEFDKIHCTGKLFEKDLRSFLCDMLGTVKSYYPKELDHFVVNKLKAHKFPRLDSFREEIFNHTLSSEGIGDLLTHKFGNFVIWGLVNDAGIRKFFIQICDFGPACNNYIEWFDKCIRHIFQQVFGVKNI